MTRKTVFSILVMILAATSCTKKGPEAPFATSAEPEKSIVISAVGETMQFDKTTLVVRAGETITLTMKNPSSTLEHNWVLTKAGKENDIGIAGIKAGKEKQFVPDDPAVLAHTKLIPPKGEDTITFVAPAAGSYPYICTNAGHHTVMKGTLISK